MSLIAKSMIVTLLLQIMILLVPIGSRVLIDNLFVFKNIFNWKHLLPLVSALALIHFVLSITKGKIIAKLQMKINKEISEKFVKKILTLPIHFFANRGTGDIVHRYTGAIVVREMISSKIISIWLDVGIIILYSIYMATISIKYVIIVFAFSVVLIIVSSYGVKKNRELLTKEVVEEAGATAFFNEIVHAISVVKMKGSEEEIFSIWNKNFSKQMNAMATKNLFMANITSIISSIQFIAPLVLFGLSARDVLQGNLTVGIVFSIYIIAQGFFAPINSIAGIILKESIRFRAAIKRTVYTKDKLL